MSIFDIFKRKPKKKPGRREARPARPAAKPLPPVRRKEVKKEKPAAEVEKKPEKIEKEVKPVKPKKAVKSAVAWKVLERPHITEKATGLTKENEYAFRVSDRSNKAEVKQAVEDVYGVDVERVRVISVPAKKRRLGRTRGWRKGYKKAIVKVKKGQEIEILPR